MELLLEVQNQHHSVQAKTLCILVNFWTEPENVKLFNDQLRTFRMCVYKYYEFYRTELKCSSYSKQTNQ